MWKSVPGSLAASKTLHADETPLPVVDQPLQRLAEAVEEHLVSLFDQLAVTMKLNGVEVCAALVEHGDAALELLRGYCEADGRGRGDDVLG